MKRLFVLASALALLACQPSDVKTKSVREVLESGGKVDFTENGFRYSGCRGADWTDYRVTSDDIRRLIISGDQLSGLNGGMSSCFRVGSTVSITSPSARGARAGLIRITKISWVKLDALRFLKGKAFANSADLNAYKDSYRAKSDDHGLVTVLEFHYIPGSAADENAPLDPKPVTP